MYDLISRQALCEYALNQKDKSITPNDIMRFPSAQPETHEERTETHGVCLDTIDRQAAIDAVMEFMPSLTTPDGCGQFDREIFEAQEMFVDIGQALNELPSAQPEIVRCNECKYAHITYGCEVKYCDIWFPDESHYMDTDNYCSFAERRTDG